MLRTYYIFTYGFTAVEENIIGKMLWNYYLEVGTNTLEAIIVAGNTDVPKQLKK